MRLVLAAVTALVLGTAVLLSSAQPGDRPEAVWVRLVFGLDDRPAPRTGSLRVENGKALALGEWGLEAADTVDAASLSWKIRSLPVKPGDKRPEYGDTGSFAESARGILVKVEAGPSTALHVETDQGRFTVTPRDLRPGRPTKVLDGRATAEPLASEDLVAATRTEDDFPALAVTPDGHRHVAWVAYDDARKAEHLLARDADDPAARPEPITAPGEFTGVHLFPAPGGLRAVWCSPGADRDWDLFTATRAGGRWSAPERLTRAAGNDFHLAADQGADGRLWLVWQSFRNGQSDVFAKCLDGGRWSDDVPVAASPANEWEPSVSVGPDGRAWVAYDTYEHGNYDVYLAPLTLGAGGPRVGERVAVARGEEFEAHASVLADRAGKVWVAFARGGPRWGKDFRAEPAAGPYTEPIHMTRRLGLRCVIDGQVHEPTAALPQDVGSGRVRSLSRRVYGDQARFYEAPQLARDRDGRVWLFFRLCRQGFVDRPRKGAVWDVFATTYTDKGWLDPVLLPHSGGRQNQRLAWAAAPDGRIHAAWAEGNHFVGAERKHAVHHGALPRVAEAAAELPLKPVAAEPPAVPESAPAAPWTLKRGAEEYVLCLGDLHRHTDISYCAATLDGSLVDAHRYALDAAPLDFLAVTDHSRDVTAYPWWRTMKTADLFTVKGRFASIYGYERSNDTPGGGHRNVFLLERGEVNRGDDYYQDRPGPAPDTRPDTALYPALRKSGGALTAAHTAAYDAKTKRGTWSYHDPEVEPVAEIFQGFRHAYERPERGVSREASIWHALEQGHRLGFIASSDHISTHVSFACVWAKEKTRPALFEALRARRTYAATDRIVLDVRLGDALMGEEARLKGGPPTLTIRATGTAPVEEIEVIRSGEVVTTLRPRAQEVETSWTDPHPKAGAAYYYVRLRQRDGHLAWGSPIWVNR